MDTHTGLAQLYCSVLAILSMSVKRWTALATRYSNTVLLSALAVYIYRDIWPLATYTEHPKDTSHDQLLWYKVAILVFTAVAVPLFVPCRYIPVDPKVCTSYPSSLSYVCLTLIESYAGTKCRANFFVVLLHVLFLSRPCDLHGLSCRAPRSGSVAPACRY